MAFDELTNARILLVDDDEDTLELVECALHRAGARHTEAVCLASEVIYRYRAFKPDVVILDLRMPPLDGFALIEQFREHDGPDRHVPVIVLTGYLDPETKQRALEAGVADFIRKDFDMAELLLRVRNVVRTFQLYGQVQRQKSWLQETVRVRTQQLREARREVLERLALAAEFRDDETGEHTRRVGLMAAQIAQAMGEDVAYVEAIGSAALLHDLGKIGIPDGLLLKQGPLDDQERDVMRQHTSIGGKILADCYEPVMRMAQEIALTHHERWDGDGYPRGLAGNDIPLSGRIVAVADSFDAMISERPYKRAMLKADAVREIVMCSGHQFDPSVVAAFLRVVQNLEGASLVPPALRRTVQPELTF